MMTETTKAKLLKGSVVRDAVLADLKNEIARLKTQTGRVPGLAVILVGHNPASETYVAHKTKACNQIGIRSFETQMSGEEGQDQLIAVLQGYNRDERVHGILLQLPLPQGYDEDRMLELISPEKDVDGFHPVNVGKLLLGLPTFQSCTPQGICELLNYHNIQTEGKHVVIVGRSNIVGKPLAAMLVQKAPYANATVTICHSRTSNMSALTQQADILVAAIGKPHFITAEMVKEGAVVIDVGINKVEAPDTPKGFRLVGDVDFEAVKEKVSAITPVPGGVGPMTIAMLMKNTVHSFKKNLFKEDPS